MRVRLLWITPPDGSLDRVEARLAERRGIPGLALLVRRPAARDRDVLSDARRLIRYGVPVLMQRADLALAVDAAGVHLPERGLDPREVRRLRASWIVGVSRHDAAGLRDTSDADYATLSPFGQVEGKNAPLGEDGFREAIRDAPLPVIALGGIDAATGAIARRAGARGLAFIRSGLDPREFAGMVKVLDSSTPLG